MPYTPQAWIQFLEDLQHNLPDPLHPPFVLESWRRSREHGVDPAPDEVTLRRVPADELEARLTANATLVSTAAPFMATLSASLGMLQHVIYITDRDGIVLRSAGNDIQMLVFGLMPGFDWSEARMGTNGAGTALAVDNAVAIIGPDHYQLPFHDVACLAAPIHSTDGKLIGAVDLSLNAKDAKAVQLDEVVRLAGRIERRLAGVISVLVVDDNDGQRYVLKRMLSGVGFTVLGASTGHDAFSKALILQPDAIVLDVSLPDMNGFEVCKQLKSDPRTLSIPVVQVSSVYTEQDAKEAGYNAGADAYLVHPVETKQLGDVIQQVFARFSPAVDEAGAATKPSSK